MAAACALAIFSGIVILISRLSRSAERSKRYFHRGIVMIKRRFQTANAGRLCDPSCEKVFQPIPQDWLKYKL